MVMMKMRMTMTNEVRDSISCLRVATEPVITKGERKLREAGGLSDTSYLVFIDRSCDKHVVQSRKSDLMNIQ